MVKWRFFAFILVVMLLFLNVQEVKAGEPYEGYIYDFWGNAVPSMNGYLPEKVVFGNDIGVGHFNLPADIFITDSGLIYILDSGNKRIIKTDGDFNVIKVIDKLYGLDGKEQTLNAPEGLFVDKDYIYVADTQNKRVVKIDEDGKILKEYLKPESEIYPQDFPFLPKNVLVDTTGQVYVVVSQLFYGAVVYDTNGHFTGFYGNNRVALTAQVLTERIWKRIFRGKNEYFANFVPAEFTNFDIDEKDFIYTCTQIKENSRDEIGVFNPKGNNILLSNYGSRDYGDLDKAMKNQNKIDTSFVDINISKEGIINALDKTRGRIFQYDKEGRLLLIFGGIYSQKGNFKNPISIESMGNKVYVLDKERRCITIFKRTEFGDLIHRAIYYYNKGDYENALDPWKEVININANYELAYEALGDAYFNMQDYEKALYYYKLGNDREGYSRAYDEVRRESVRDNFGLYVFGVILIFLILAALINKNELKSVMARRKIVNE